MSELKAMKKIDKLIGATEFKARMREIASIIPAAKEKGITSTLFLRNYLFSIDRGCGLTTCLELMKELIEESGVRLCDTVETKAVRGAEYASAGYSYPPKNDPGIICIDLSDWMTKVDLPEFRGVLCNLRRRDDKSVYVFRIPPVEENTLRKVHDALYDIMYVTDVVFEPLTKEDMMTFAERLVKQKGYKLARQAHDPLFARIERERADGKFYGFDTVDKVVSEELFKKLIKDAAAGKSDGVIGAEDIGAVGKTERRRDPLDKFDDYVGMEDVKRQISEIISQIKYLKARKGVSMPCIHMRFVGNPGTGKTTAARIVGESLASCGVLRNGAFFEYTGRALIGQHIGETEARTAGICRAAYGSVLFIDEAYALSFSDNDSRDFGNEALSVLVAEMENHRSDLVVIMAGYEKEMDILMKSNPGLESRMPYVITFSCYTREQLFTIFMNMVRSEFEYTEDLEAGAKRYFASIPDSVIDAPDFSNARFVRNLYERCQRKALVRCMKTEKDVVICGADFEEALDTEAFSFEADGRNPIGF